MKRFFLASLALVAISFLSTGCIKAKFHTVLDEKGAGTMEMDFGVTEKMVEIIKKLEEIDPDQANDMEAPAFEELSDEEKAAMAEKGLTILEMTSDEEKMKAHAKFAFDRIEALRYVDEVQESGDSMPMRLVKNDDGSYTLSMLMGESGDDEEFDEEGFEDGFEEGMDEEETEPVDPMEEQQKMMEMMALMGEMMAEMQNMAITIGMEVPGEIVSFEPEGATQEENTVAWKLDSDFMMQQQMEQQMGGEEEGMTFSVTFKMPEGKELPESALYAGPADEDEDGEDEDGEEDMDNDGMDGE